MPKKTTRQTTRQTTRIYSVVALSLMLLGPAGCGDGGPSVAIPYPTVSRWHFTVTNNMRMKITSVVISKLDLPVKFEVLEPGQTRTLIGAAQRLTNKIELSWDSPEGARKFKTLKFKPILPASFNGKIYLKIIDPNKVELRVDTFPEPK